MNLIRVLVGDLPGILADVVIRLLEAQPDIVPVGRSEGGGDALLAAARERRPDVVVLGLGVDSLSPGGELLLRQIPSVRILGVARRRGHVFLYEMRPHRSALGKLSPEGFIDAIRAAVDAGRASVE